MKIHELLDPYAGAMHNDSYDDEDLEFSTTIGETTYGFNFVRTEDEPWYVFTNLCQILDDDFVNGMFEKYGFDEDTPITLYDFTFHLLAEDGGRIYDLTGKGQGTVATVFSAAKRAFDEFREKKGGNFDILHFTAKEKSRIALYNRFAMMMAKSFGWSLETFEATTKKHYFLINTKQAGNAS